MKEVKDASDLNSSGRLLKVVEINAMISGKGWPLSDYFPGRLLINQSANRQDLMPQNLYSLNNKLIYSMPHVLQQTFFHVLV